MAKAYKNISEIGKVITGKTPPTDNDDYYGGIYQFITPSDISTFTEKYIEKTERTISDVGAKYLKETLLPANSTCFVCIGSTIGKMCKTICDSFTNQQLNSIIPNETIDDDYLFYYMRHIKAYFQSVGGGTGSGKGIINKSFFSKTKIYIEEDKNKQKLVSTILSTYDNLIMINNRRTKALEQIVEIIYKEWFVHLRFPEYEKETFSDGVPKGWKKKKLRDIAVEVGNPEKAENKDHYSHYLPIDKIPAKSMVLQEEDSIDNAESSLLSFKKGDLLFGAMRPYLHKVIIAPFDGLTRSTCFVVNSIKPEYKLFLYLLLYQKSSVDYATTVSVGSTMPYARWSDFSRMNIIVPEYTIVERFNKIVDPIIQHIQYFYDMNLRLIKQRDLLLPRLMSGKLEV